MQCGKMKERTRILAKNDDLLHTMVTIDTMHRVVERVDEQIRLCRIGPGHPQGLPDSSMLVFRVAFFSMVSVSSTTVQPGTCPLLQEPPNEYCCRRQTLRLAKITSSRFQTKSMLPGLRTKPIGVLSGPSWLR